MSISAKELAKKLNISAATVSMVLNNKPGISEKTRELVLSAAHEYGFDFSKLEAKASASGNIQLVIYKKHGIVVTDTPFFSQLLEGIEQCCKNKSYSLQITYFYEKESCEEQIESIKKSGCDGILLLGTEMQLEDFKHFNNLNIPLVVMDTYFDELDYDFVTINNIRGTFNATEYLISQGFNDIGYLRSSCKISNFTERFDGYCKAMKKHNLKIKSEYIHNITPSLDGAYEDIKNILPAKYAKAYVADNDLIAAGSMRALKEYGIKIPEDVSVIGFDNMPFCDILDPQLSTLDVQKHEFGTLAVKQLINRIQNQNHSYSRIQITPELRKRKSINLL